MEQKEIREKICVKCKKLKTLNSFYKDKYSRDGKSFQCKKCRLLARKYSYAKSIGKSIDQIRKPHKIIDGKKECRKCGIWKEIKFFSNNVSTKDKLSHECKVCICKYVTIGYKILKMEFLIAYGGRCICCGESKMDLLTVEHVKFKGYKLIYEQTNTLIRKLKDLGWPKEGYEIKCYNCNLSTKYGTPCAHDTEKYKKYMNNIENCIGNVYIKNRYFRLKQKLNEVIIGAETN
jgi:hypothetical protein